MPRFPRIYPKLEKIKPGTAIRAHGIDYRVALDMAKEFLGERESIASEEWTFPPVLACRDKEKYLTLYDGHHRDLIGVMLQVSEIPAYIFYKDQLNAVVSTYFNGYEPSDLYLLDPYIILPDGKRYEDSEIR